MSHIGTFIKPLAMLNTLTPDAGGAVAPVGNTITLAGGNNIGTVGTPGTITFNLDGTTDHALQVGNAGGSLTSLAVATNGQIPIGSNGANPVVANITSTGGTVTVTNGAGSINLEVAGGGLIWLNATGVSQAMAVDTGYVANRAAGTLAFTLPATAAVADVIAIAGSQNGWTLAQNAGQTIHFISGNTTTGVGGSLASTTRYDCIELICNVANTDFVVRSVTGNIVVT